ncbi:MAG: right-handed parallel beta-helix repeat-containing protein [Clostridiales bacterium]|nr:right-handed parallel beta-helix repeat-containing protein [Clostridiales bacterium]
MLKKSDVFRKGVLRSSALIISLCLLLSSFGLTGLSFDEFFDNVFYVSPSGDDGGSGSFELPFKTVEGAERYLSENASELGGKTVVYLREGVYRLNETLKFDSSFPSNVTFKAYKNESASISGSRTVSGFKREKVNGVDVFVKELGSSPENAVRSLFRGDETLTAPRYPESGYLHVDSVNTDDNLYTEDSDHWSLTLGQQSFNASLDDVDKKLFKNDDVLVRILHYWKDDMAFVKSFDSDTGRVRLSRPASIMIHKGDRYFFENVFEALDSPGEWYFDKESGKLYYVPYENEDPDTLELQASKAQKLIEIDGADNITFENIAFRDTAWELAGASAENGSSQFDIEHNLDTTQAALYVNGVITVKNSKSPSFKNCDFINLGGTALKIKENVSGAVVDSCYLYNIAGCGIFAGGRNVAAGKNGSVSDVTITNNIIHKFGREFYNAVGIHITYCDTAVLANNEIHDGYYTGVSCGWVWGFTYHATRNIQIKDNLIYDIGQEVLSDMGGIYTLGVQSGTVISGNVIHNVTDAPDDDYGEGAHGIYLDEGSSDIIVERNLVFACSDFGLNIHYGEGNVFRNNISALNEGAAVNVGGNPEWLDRSHAFYYNNIYLTDNSPVYVNMKDTDHFYENGNLIWDIKTGAKKLHFEVDLNDRYFTLKQAEMCDFIHLPVLSDPLFKDAENFDFTFSDEKTAEDMGFDIWDYDDAGTLAGSVIGTDHEGGTLRYNDGAKALDKTEIKYRRDLRYILYYPFVRPIIKAFKNIRQYFEGLFNK